MPRGLHLAQGRNPLGPDSGNDDEVISSRWGSPPSSRGGSHAQIYATPNQDASSTTAAHSTPGVPLIVAAPKIHDSDDDRMLAPEKRRGTGRVFPTKFAPPSSTITPTELFLVRANHAHFARYVHRHDPRKVLIFTDGSCLNNGQPNPKAGWAVVYGPSKCFTNLLVPIASGRLENKGPFGDLSIQSSNRAELRAVIAALRLQHWTSEGFNTIVIATDSDYVATGATEWTKTWINNGWRTASNRDVKNKDLWEMLLGEVERWQDEGLSIQFWNIPRDWNEVADAAAKKAAEKYDARDTWIDVSRICL
ncbi:hypothetical protein E0Z10_g5804 [Xylaria hypoxylon]|uniref:ribonuclease H n=1 Tax=Xylaria hypoxylon TaxID=37992 RepID=A0A4Z0Z034_9PEZI|nr:hypothetical protein E0Z10_g5804 [Xylaria hypoxylon]